MIEDIEKKEIFKRWNYAVPRGWHNLFWDMLTCIQWYMHNNYPKWTYDILEVKEKYNTLTIYDCCYDEDGNRKDVPNEIINIVRLAFEKSLYICPICGGEKDCNPYVMDFTMIVVDEYKFCPNCGKSIVGKDINVRSKNEPRKLSSREWKEFLSKQFGISKTSAKEMLHGMMQWKNMDNFKRIFNPIKEEDEERMINENKTRF